MPRSRRPGVREIRATRRAECSSSSGSDGLGVAPATDLSGGQQQRLALARASSSSPRCSCSTSRSRASTPSCARDVLRAQAPPADARHHDRLRDPRPGRGARHVERHRGHAKPAGSSQIGDPARDLCKPCAHASSPSSSATRTSSKGSSRNGETAPASSGPRRVWPSPPGGPSIDRHSASSSPSAPNSWASSRVAAGTGPNRWPGVVQTPVFRGDERRPRGRVGGAADARANRRPRSRLVGRARDGHLPVDASVVFPLSRLTSAAQTAASSLRPIEAERPRRAGRARPARRPGPAAGSSTPPAPRGLPRRRQR